MKEDMIEEIVVGIDNDRNDRDWDRNDEGIMAETVVFNFNLINEKPRYLRGFFYL